MENKSSTFQKIMVAMKRFSTIVLIIGALCLILSVSFSIFGCDWVGLTLGELLVSSVVVMIIGAAGEDLFDSILYG